ncbi:MAG: thioredoxin domain-containing protein [Myxococcota bacterium]
MARWIRLRAHALLLVLALIGLADSAYLVHVKWMFLANPSYDGGMCGLGGGCDQLQHSVMAEIPVGGAVGIPIALLGAGFYVAFLALLVVRMRAARRAASEAPATGESRAAASAQVTRRLHLGMALLGTVYSLVLLAYSLSVGLFCPFCGVLYGVNLLSLLVSALSLAEAPGTRLSTFVKSAFGAVATRSGAIAFAVFALTVGVGFAVFVATIPPPPKFADPLTETGKPHHAFDSTGRATRGPEDAPLRIVEFADFECPHCRALFHTLEDVLAERGQRVHLTFMHFPLDQACNRAVPGEFHKRACELAVLGECANRQGRFFDVAGTLFDEGPATPAPALVDRLVGLGLDRAQLAQCVADPATTAAIKQDIETGLAAGVNGTPAVYVNGVEAGGARPREFFEMLIEQHSSAPSGRPAPSGGEARTP